jgi:5-methylcytosine-specific restriction enzyme subunit McrC
MLFEFSQDTLAPGQRKSLEEYLQKVWENRLFAYSSEYNWEADEEDKSGKQQPFLKFDGDKYKTQNFIGFIYHEGTCIEIYPKVFKHLGANKKDLMLQQVFYWFSYCSKLNFPFLDAPLDKLPDATLPELLIWQFASYTHQLLNNQPFSQYEEVEEIMLSPKGRINFTSYISNGLSRGNYHQIDCVYEPFVYDNTLNRAIKYVARLLLKITRIEDTRSLLDQMIFILDEVTDQPCSAADLNRIRLNNIFSDYAPIIEWCKRFLEQQLYSSAEYETNQWSLLLPMEYVFEDFVAGFLKKHFSNKFKIRSQASDLYLQLDPKVFQLQHDILLENSSEKLIIDTKYKPRWHLDPNDPKQGVAQSDMYQMISYAYRRGCNKVILLYPNTSENLSPIHTFKINSGLEPGHTIYIQVAEIPFWNAHYHTQIEARLLQEFDKLLST